MKISKILKLVQFLVSACIDLRAFRNLVPTNHCNLFYFYFYRCLDCPPGKDQMTVDELNVVTKDSEKLDEEFSEDHTEDISDSLSENEDEKFDDIQTIDT